MYGVIPKSCRNTFRIVVLVKNCLQELCKIVQSSFDGVRHIVGILCRKSSTLKNTSCRSHSSISAQTLYVISIIYPLPVLQIWQKTEVKCFLRIVFFHPSLVTDIGCYRQERVENIGCLAYETSRLLQQGFYFRGLVKFENGLNGFRGHMIKNRRSASTLGAGSVGKQRSLIRYGRFVLARTRWTPYVG